MASLVHQAKISRALSPFQILYVICFCYWGYLFFNAAPILKFDAVQYEYMGSVIYKEGWVEYFRTGPYREPLHPFIISMAMRIADYFTISYYPILKIFQLLLLLITFTLTHKILNHMRIDVRIQWPILLYLGLSPSLVNSAFSLFREITILPFMPAIILFNVYSWAAIHKGDTAKVVWSSLALGLAFLGATFTRDSFFCLFFLSLIPYLIVIFRSLFSKNKFLLKHAGLYLSLTILGFYPPVMGFQYLTKLYNPNFQIMSREYAKVLYGTASKRARFFTPRELLTHLAFVPGGGFCQRFFKVEECKACDFDVVDTIYHTELSLLLQDIPENHQVAKILLLTVEKIREKPLQYILFMIMEGMKMFFWESTQIGFVLYPSWLTALFNFSLFKDGLRLTLALLSLFATLHTFVYLCGKRSFLLKEGPHHPSAITTFFILYLIFTYTLTFTSITVITRYAFPLGSLFLCLIALSAHIFLNRAVKNEPRKIWEDRVWLLDKEIRCH